MNGYDDIYCCCKFLKTVQCEHCCICMSEDEKRMCFELPIIQKKPKKFI